MTGTPFVLTSLASCTEAWTEPFERWISAPIHSTLAQLYRQGQYLRSQRPSQVGLASEFEPPRHVAGALLCKVLLGRAAREDERSIEYLTQVTTHEMAWDLAISARALLTAGIDPQFSRKARNRAAAYGEELIRLLVVRAEMATSHAGIWANPYGYGTRDESQWSTVWAVLPLLKFPPISGQIRAKVQLAIEQLLWSLRNSASDTLQVFSRATRLTAMKAIVEVGRSEYGLPMKDIHESMAEESRVFFADPRALLLAPIENWETRDVAVEGFVGWAGVCAAAGAFGVRLSPREIEAAKALAVKIEERLCGVEPTLRTELCLSIVEQSGPFIREYRDTVAQAATQVLALKDAVQGASTTG